MLSIRTMIVTEVRNQGRDGSDTSSHRVSCDRGKFGEQAAAYIVHEPFVPHSHVEALDGVRDRTGIRAVEEIQDL